MASNKGVKFTVKDNTLFIQVDLTGNYGPSSTGATTSVAYCQETLDDHGITFQVNAYKKIPKHLRQTVA